ncbi:MAG TPA: 2Fe-2S iron-sulfur cluster-binding protein, partial [Novosphingobium sp.]|nr:2Fe-2S iron-sulfur cluster-binding protein [Novosphingobium sp.]
MSRLAVSTTVNGDPVDYLCAPGDTLLDALRGPLGLTGSKEGCGSGDCGACTVMVDGVVARSCLMLAVQADGSEVTTLAGLAAPDGTLHPVQQAMVDHHGSQ